MACGNCNGCGGGSGNGSSVGTLAGQPANPYAVTPAAFTGPVTTPTTNVNTGGCVGCAQRSDNLWRDILMSLIIALVVGGLFFGRER